MIIKYQGESLLLEVNVTDRLGEDFNFLGATPIFSITRSDYGSLITKTPTVVGNVLSIGFTPLETSTMLGVYVYEIKIKDQQGNVDMIERDEILILTSNNPTFGTI